MKLKTFLTTLITVLIITSMVMATAPQLVNYQGQLTDGSGNPVADGTYSIIFTIYDAPSGGNVIWTETQFLVVVTGGFFNTLLGSVTPLNDIVFNDSTRYLGVKVGGDPEISPRIRLVTVAFAFRASTIDGASGGTITGDVNIIGKANIGIDNKNTGNLAYVAGAANEASGDYSTVSGGSSNTASGTISTIGGGTQNIVDGTNATVGGGFRNKSSNQSSTVSGGYRNFAAQSSATVSGGNSDTASGQSATVGGGSSNVASGNWSTVSGGGSNVASGSYATVPGGYFSIAKGEFSMAVGKLAKANHDGSIVIAAQNSPSLADSSWTSGNEQMLLRADGGFFITNASGQAWIPNLLKLINTSTGAYLSSTGIWTNASDKNIKENFTNIDGDELLDKISSLEISEWNYKKDDDSVKHIGPVAQDFYKVLGLGYDDKTISTIDPAGVALAAIKELHKENKELKQIIEELQQRLSKLER